MACAPGDFNCYISDWFANQVAPYSLYIVIGFFAFIMLFFKWWRILGALILVGLVLWFVGIPTILPPFRTYFGA